MGPVPGLEVTLEPFQVDSGEVSADSFPQPPLPLSCAGAARLAELVPEMFSSDPPGQEKNEIEGRMEEEEEEAKDEGLDFDEHRTVVLCSRIQTMQSIEVSLTFSCSCSANFMKK